MVSVAAAYKRAAEGAGAGTDGVPDALLLKSCLEQVRFRGREVVAVLSPPDLEFHALQLPEKVLDSADVAESGAVNLEIERLVTSPGSTPETRYWRLPPPAGSNPNLMGVAAGGEGGAGRDADRRGGVGAGETGAGGGEPVDVGRLDEGMAITSSHLLLMLVGHDEKNVHRRHRSFHPFAVVGAILAHKSAPMAPAIVPDAPFVYPVPIVSGGGSSPGGGPGLQIR